MNRPNVALIGFQACGKTTLGALLAQSLKRSFVDTDRLIESYHPGLRCYQIFSQLGEAHFRHLESQVIGELRQKEDLVIALGGGSLVPEANRLSLKQHSTLLYLKVPMHVLKRRIWSRPQLPAYLDARDPHASFYCIYHERTAVYEALADQIIELSFASINKSVKYIQSCIKNL